jgi:zinc transporter ZupT
MSRGVLDTWLLATEVATVAVIAGFVLSLRLIWTGKRSWVIWTYAFLTGACSIIGIVRLLGFG